jgi:hypothetical protein
MCEKLEHYTLPVNRTLSPVSSDENHNCVVDQSMSVWNSQTKTWDFQKTATSDVNVLGDVVYLIPSVVPVNGMCVSTRLYGRACTIAANTMAAQLSQRGQIPFATPSDLLQACDI